MSEELEVLKIVTERFRQADIAYMVTGSVAMNYDAAPRMTRDGSRPRVSRPMDAGRRPRRRVPIDWDDLEIALTWQSDEHSYYLDLRTGKVPPHANWADEDIGGLSEEQLDEGLAEGRFVRVEPLPSSTEYHWMVRFAASVSNLHLRELLDVAVRGRGAFRRFKDVLTRCPAERERWFAFHDARVREAMIEWLEEHDIDAPTGPPERSV